jgi:hypothetical protein
MFSDRVPKPSNQAGYYSVAELVCHVRIPRARPDRSLERSFT